MQAVTNLCACPSKSKVKLKNSPTTLLGALLIAVSLALVTMFIVIYKYKGTGTIVVASLISAGIIIIAYSELYSGQVSHNEVGFILLVIGAWANGSLLFVVKLLKSAFRKNAEVCIYG